MDIRHLAILAMLAPAVAGCLGSPAPVQQPNPTGATDMVPALGPVVEEIPGDVVLSATTPARTVNNGGAFATVITPAANISGFIAEVTWDAATPASQQLSVWVRVTGVGTLNPPNQIPISGAEPIARVDGPSPIRVVLPAELFTEESDYDIIVRASGEPAGVAVNQPFVIHLATFLDVPFDADYTMMEGHGHA